ncbi:MAG: ShlB/FhaC/HecB family hemolysin secretion/activation protein [Synechococcales bacterium]|nr:ShlB/FhaC/HecB family hemolysin secretion/activation protein [Synechococcales bacterium]
MHCRYPSRFIASLASLAILSQSPIARSQSSPPPGITLPPNLPDRIEDPPAKPSESPLSSPTPSAPSPNLQIPELPSPPQALPSEPPQETPVPNKAKFRIQQVEVLGNTVLQAEIAQLTQPFTNKLVSFEDLVQLRSAITQLYLDQGYITSGAFLSTNQSLRKGIVQIQVIEGRLEKINITGLTRLRESYVRSRLAIASQPPLSRANLERSLQLLQLDPLLQQVNAELTAGSAPGLSVLRLQLKEAPPFSAGLEIANNQAPSIGSIQGNLFASYANVTGFGDRLQIDYGRTEGLENYGILYSVPFNGLNGNFSVRYSKNNSEIIEAVFRDLGIRSRSETLSFNLRQPVIRSPQTELAFGLALDIRRSQTFLLDDIPFSFSEGPEQGRSKVTVLRFYQDWVNRSATRVLAARSQFSFGLNAFGATVNDVSVDGRFFAWLGQFQWVQQISPRVLMVARIDTQLTPDPLLSLEQLSLGGVDTVRGYRQNQLVADNGLLAALEFRIPLTRNPQILQITPFIEFGMGWNNRSPQPDPKLIAGIGTGLRWQIARGFNLRLDYGFPLIPLDDRGDSLQDQGFYFSLNYQPI